MAVSAAASRSDGCDPRRRRIAAGRDRVAAITTRKLAERAGVNHGLIHYYFGSMEEVFLQVLERYTGRLTARQREL